MAARSHDSVHLILPNRNLEVTAFKYTRRGRDCQGAAHTQNKGAEQEIPCSALAVAGLTNRYASRAGGRGAGAGVTPAGWATGTGAAAAGALGAGAAATGALGA